MEQKETVYYAQLAAQNVLLHIDSNEKGLTQAEAENRLEKYGKNILVDTKKQSIFAEFLSHCKNPLTLILFGAAATSAIFGEYIDAVIIASIVIISVLLDFFQEHSASLAAQKLQESVKTTATVVRDGIQKEIKVEEVCIGDILVLEAGDLVPADARLIVSKSLFANQSALTGESFPVGKTEQSIASSATSLTEMNNTVFFGTNVVSGSARAVVIKTGKETEFGKIAHTLVKPEETSEFEQGIMKFGLLVAKVTVGLVLFFFLFNTIVKHDALQAFSFAIAVAVGLTPELLPMVLSVTMAKGAQSMAQRGVIVKRQSAMPNYGSMDVLCTDKTGTLTEDHIALVKHIDVAGKDSEDVFTYAYLNSHFHTGITNPLDDALLAYRKIDTDLYRKIDEIPFDFVRRLMSVVLEQKIKRKSNYFIITKGAPEEVFKRCSHYVIGKKKVKLSPAKKESIFSEYHALSAQGYRVLAVARSEKIKKIKKSFSASDEKSLILIGFVAFLDPPKPNVGEILANLKTMGITVKVITGDNELITQKICNDIGLEVQGVLLGSQVSEMNDDALKIKVETTTIFARFSPEQKNRVISALRANGHVVGYMGDGINDAPSLKTADVGISVNNAVDVAKESADMILTSKSLNVLRDGVYEGRKTFGNTMKYIMLGLSSNFGNMFSIAAGVLFLPFLPMLPIQILLNNLIYNFSQITIPSDNVDEEFVQNPKRWNLPFIKKFMIVFGITSSLFDIALFFVLFKVFNAPEAVFQTAWFVQSLTTQTLVIHVIRTKKIPLIQSRPSALLLLSSLVCVAIGWLIPFTPLAVYVGMVPIATPVILVILATTAAYFIVVEIVKHQFYKRVQW